MSKRATPRQPQQERPRGGPARAVADLLPQVGGAAFKRYGFVQAGIVTRWAEIVGPRYADVSTPESIRFPPGRKAEGVLTVTVKGAHAAMMQHIAPEIVERVNRFFGYAAVARLTLKQGQVAPRPSRVAPPSLRAIAPPARIGEGLRAIADPELRAVLGALAAGVAATHGPPIVGDELTNLVVAGKVR
ncbi:MAG: DUF721 domain-containing protein [Sphingomonas sp.]|uniref:DUF721 domain-containing protein n=1 Tax=Sphingomonas sp. TaxID=28214 RepID=UPI001AC66221|nr:DUF721 domain-containing protein [Sphingomonas sp.]MBN8809008.1 DUF721 domain-containing protein [Sphingomonas sp.]